MSTVAGLQWASVILSLVAAILAGYSTARFPVVLARSMPTWWGSLVPAKIVLEQKAYSAGALWAISSAFLFQMLSMVAFTTALGIIAMVVGAVLASGIIIMTQMRRHGLVSGYLKWAAQQRTPQGEIADVERVKSGQEQFVEQIGLFYDLPRRGREELDAYRARLARHVQNLAKT
jgi:hypothetical protein